MTSNICTILEQRRQLALLRKPANRYEGKLYNNPYESGYTKEQLDMRRKAEILQYKKNSSQIGGMTKKGKYAKLFTIAGNNNICPLDVYLPTPTSSSNVPGPIITLQYTDSIPLYNIASDADNYANLNPDVNSEFEVYYENNVLIANGYNPSTKIASLLINNPRNLTRNFNISVPIGLYISADASGNNVYDAKYQISNITFGVYYNGTLIPGTKSTSAEFSNKSVHIISNTNRGVFSGVSYIGSLNIPVKLDTQKGFVYEFRMSATSGIIVENSGKIKISVVGAFANVSNGLSPINCSISLSSGSPNPAVNPGKLTVT
jgi:hypothetical protein